ncbi:MAG: hypothetical protein ACW9W4_02915 [Candidatus Nitrosopumilus sp. bin_7KS]
MNRKGILMILPLICAIALMFVPYDAYAHNGHNHNKGSGCTGCTPPTLGVDGNGKRLVSGGITILDQTYDVELFKQDLNPQLLKVGEPAEIMLKIYDETGYDDLKHIELSLGVEDKLISGVLVPYSPVTVEWDKTFDGMTTVSESNKESLVKDIAVQVVDNSPLIGLKFTFTPTQEFNANTILVKAWDQKRNANINYFYNALEIIPSESSFLLASASELSSSDSDDNQAELTSMDLPIDKVDLPIDKVNQEIQCSSGQERMLRVSDMSPVCVSVYQSSVLIENNWAVYDQ